MLANDVNRLLLLYTNVVEEAAVVELGSRVPGMLAAFERWSSLRPADSLPFDPYRQSLDWLRVRLIERVRVNTPGATPGQSLGLFWDRLAIHHLTPIDRTAAKVTAE